MSQRRQKFVFQPLISIIVPVFNPPKIFLEEMLNSVIDQTYHSWELCIADGNSNAEIQQLLLQYAGRDSRIKLKLLEQNQHICGNSNAAIELANGEYICLLDHDDLLPPQSLFEIVSRLNQDSSIDLVYTDEDFYAEGRHILAHFKPDFAPDTLRETNYITHFICFKAILLQKISTPVFNSEFQGAQDYDLILRLSENALKIVHIPQVLYHWRMHQNSSLGNASSKMYAYENGHKVIESHLQRIGRKAEVVCRENMLGIYKVNYQLIAIPLISILIPNKDNHKILDNCIQSILNKTSYPNFEIIIAENNSENPQTFAYYNQLKEPKVRVHYIDIKGFNYSTINNQGIKYCNGEFLVFLNNDTEIIIAGWLEELLQYAQFPEIGAVGAKLYFPDNSIQHAGIVIGPQGLPGNLFGYHSRYNIAQFAHTHRVQNFMAVTAACLMVNRSKFDMAGGFDENFAIAFNDVDLCLKLVALGYLNIFNPDAELYHYESKSRGSDSKGIKKARFLNEYAYLKSKWGSKLYDPYYPQIFDNYNYTWK